MEKSDWTKTKGFRLPKRTLDQLDFLVEKGAGKSATEVVIIAIERLATQYEMLQNALSSSSLLDSIIGYVNGETHSAEYQKKAEASVPDHLIRDRETMFKVLRGYWNEDDIEKLKDMSDDDLKKVIAIRISISKKQPIGFGENIPKID